MKTNSYSTIRQIFLTLILLCVCLLPHQMVRAESTAPTQGGTTIYMPFFSTSPRVVGYLFNTSKSCAGDFEGEAQNAPATFSYGFKRLGHATRVLGGVGLTWREEWTRNGEVVDALTDTGTITEANELIQEAIVYGPSGTCGKNIPADQWIVRFYLDGRLAQEAVVMIR